MPLPVTDEMVDPGLDILMYSPYAYCCLLQEVHRACYIKLSGATVKSFSLVVSVVTQMSFSN